MPKTPDQHPHATWRATFAFCARYWGREKGQMAIVMALLVAMAAAEVAVPVAAGRVVDGLTSAASGAPADAAYWALGMMTAVLLGNFMLNDAAFRVWNRVQARNIMAVLEEGFERVQKFSSDWHANTFAGATVHKLSRGKWSYDRVSDVVWMRFLPLGLTLTGLSVVMISRFPLVGAVFVLVISLYLAVSAWLAIAYVRPAKIRAGAVDSQLGGTIADAISNNAAVKAFGAEEREMDLFRQVTARWRLLSLRGWRRGLDMGVAQQVLWIGLQAGMLGLLIQLSVNGQATPGDVTFVIAASFQLGGHLRQIGDHMRVVQQAISELGDLIEYADAPAGVPDIPGAPVFQPRDGEIVFDAVRFAYPAQTPLYDGFDLRIRPGERVGLVGPSGSGKSTFVKLIQRLYDVQDGVIWIDGQDISQVQQASLRRAVSTVPQEPVLFHRSLADNIGYARPDAPLSDIIACAKRARAHDFIARLPDGYDTLVGERGVKLSGGERQRVAIARAFLADAPIVIFDEATSSLDTITEKLIQAAMEELMEGRTTIIVAHRLSTVKDVDRILVFDRGRVVEQGSHRELLGVVGGRYRELYDVQGADALIG